MKRISQSLSPTAFVRQAQAVQIDGPSELCFLKAYRLEGDKQALEHLLYHAQWAAAVKAKEYARNANAPDHFYDMLQVGMIGVMKAVEKCDLTNGKRFSEYALYYAEGEIYDYAASSIGSLVRGAQTFTDETGKRQRTKLVTKRDHSIHQKPDGEEGSWLDTLLEPAPSAHDMAADSQTGRQQLHQLEAALRGLEYKQRVVVEDRLLGEMGLKEVANRLGGISTQRTSDIAASAIMELRRRLTEPTQTDMQQLAMKKKSRAASMSHAQGQSAVSTPACWCPSVG